MRKHTLLALVLGTTVAASAQSVAANKVYRAMVVDGDTMPVMQLRESVIEARWTPRDRRQAERYDRITRNVLKVYPYARVTAELLREYEHDLARIQREADQDLYIKLAEAELRAEFEEEIKDLTASQGRILVKLIDRETGRTSYELVKELRGGFTAFIWQGAARLFGQDLKSSYDALGDDRMLELVVLRIQAGELAAQPLAPRTARAQARLDKRKQRLQKRYRLQDHAWSPQ
jgi:hypothetical protein